MILSAEVGRLSGSSPCRAFSGCANEWGEAVDKVTTIGEGTEAKGADQPVIGYSHSEVIAQNGLLMGIEFREVVGEA